MVKVTTEIEYCSLCPFAKIDGPYWNPDFDEDNFTINCTKLNKSVFQDLHWTECAAKNVSKTGLDKPGDFCPFNKNNNC